MAHFVTPFNYDTLENVHAALNGLLPSDIRVREISAALPEFHARFSAKSKVYHYKIYNDSIMDPFQRHYVYHSVYKLNTAAMREAAKYFIGKHDFSAFVNVSRNNGVRDPVKTIFHFDVNEMVILDPGIKFLQKLVHSLTLASSYCGFTSSFPSDLFPSQLLSFSVKLRRNEASKLTLLLACCPGSSFTAGG